FDGDDILLIAVDFIQASIQRRAFTRAGRTAGDEQAVGQGGQAVNRFPQLVAHTKLFQVDELRRLVQHAHYQLFANYAAGRGNAEIDGLTFDFGGKTAVLRLAFLGDVQRTKHLENVDDRVPHGPAQRLAGVQNAVNAKADRHLLT